MANSPATATTGGSVVRDWSELRPLGGRAVATRAAHATVGVTSELVVVQRFPLDAAARATDAQRDARALLALRHPNVARVRDVFERDGELVIVTQFVDGETLGSLRRAAEAKGERIPFAIELRILVDVLGGVGAIHGVRESLTAPKPLGILHGEVAPTNVIVGSDGVARVVQLAGVHLAQPGSAGETLGYVAPEILLADEGVDLRADVYGAGVILWEALTGQPLFTESSAGAIVTRHLSGRIRRATAPSDSAWAEPLIDVAHKALSTDPSARHATAAELASEIKRIAKTNLASAAKVAAFVKEVAADAIAERRKALAPFGRGAAAKTPAPTPAKTPAPAPVNAAKLARPAPPKPAPAAAPPTTKPVDSEEIAILSEDFEESAVKPRAIDAPPEPSVHDRITTPSPLVVEGAKRALDPQTTGEIESAILESILESDPPPPIIVDEPPAPVAAASSIEPEAPSPPARVPTPAPVPPAAFAPLITPAPERLSGESANAISLQPPAAAPAPLEAPKLAFDDDRAGTSTVAPLGGEVLDAPPASTSDDARRKRRGIVLVVLAAAVAVLLLAIVKTSRRPAVDEADAKGPPPKTATPDERATAAAPAVAPAADPAIAATSTPEPAAAPPTAATSEAAPSAAAASEPTAATSEPTAAATAKAAAPTLAPAAPKTKPKPSSTYDPLGI